jgi:hypothetical protein
MVIERTFCSASLTLEEDCSSLSIKRKITNITRGHQLTVSVLSLLGHENTEGETREQPFLLYLQFLTIISAALAVCDLFKILLWPNKTMTGFGRYFEESIKKKESALNQPKKEMLNTHKQHHLLF